MAGTLVVTAAYSGVVVRLAAFVLARTPLFSACVAASWTSQADCDCDASQKPLRSSVSSSPSTKLKGSNGFYSQSKANRCVCCGNTQHYLRYRVVPACYRKHFPIHLKSHRSHDVVLLCVDCHEKAHKAAERTKRVICQEYGVPLLPPRPTTAITSLPPSNSETTPTSSASIKHPVAARSSSCDAQVHRAEEHSGLIHPPSVRRAALALQKAAGSMPEERIRELEGLIKTYLGRNPHAEPAGLRPGDLEAGLMAGLSRRGRNRLIRKLIGDQSSIDGDQAMEHSAADQESCTQSNAEAHSTTDAAVGVGDDHVYMSAVSKDNEQHALGLTSRNIIEELAYPTIDAAERTAMQDSAAPLSLQHADVVATSSHQHGHSLQGILSAASAAAAVHDSYLDSGHMWHGERVVALAMTRGGVEEIHALIRRFRASFVEACQPAYLPPSWGVDHQAKREFGVHSVYYQQQQEQNLVPFG